MKVIDELRWNKYLFFQGSFMGILAIGTIASILFIASPFVFEVELLEVKTIVVYLLLFFVISVNEEIFARGLILGNLRKSMHNFFALILSSLFFALLHIFNLGLTYVGFINLFLAGMILGMVYLKNNNMWGVIGLHFTWNFVQGVICGFKISGVRVSSVLNWEVENSNLINGGYFGLEGSIITTISLALVCIYFFVDSKKMYFPIRSNRTLAT